MLDGLERLLDKYGTATVIVLFLLWWLTNGVSGAILDVKKTLDVHSSETSFFLRAICINSAHDEAQRLNCLPPGAYR